MGTGASRLAFTRALGPVVARELDRPLFPRGKTERVKGSHACIAKFLRDASQEPGAGILANPCAI